MIPLVTDPSGLQILWFILVAVLWIGFFFLEGFDYGVAMLLPVLPKGDAANREKERRVMINTIGPVWDGNEVWLLTAGGATFAAFPGWYSTLFSGLYLPLLLVLVGLIIRGVSFEYRAKHDDSRWRSAFDWCSTIGSLIVALVLGVGFANFVIGMPVALAGNNLTWVMTGGFWGLFSWYGLVGGLLFVALFLTHGAVFLSLKTDGQLRENARAFASKAGLVTIVLMLVFVLGLNLAYPASGNAWVGGAGNAICWIVGLLTLASLGISWFFNSKGREGYAFIFTGLAIVTMLVMIFTKIYGTLGFDSSSITDAAKQLDMTTASSSPMTLQIMSIAAVVFVPIVLAYQAWSYWIFRRRLSTKNIPVVPAFLKAKPAR